MMHSYKNGKQAREMVRDSCAGGDWKVGLVPGRWSRELLVTFSVVPLQEFDQLLDKTKPGNRGNIGQSTLLYKVLTPSSKHPYKSLWAYGSS